MRSSVARECALLALIMFPFAPIVIVLHECAHAGMAHAFGGAPTIHHASVSWGELRPGGTTLTKAAGPAVEATLGALGTIALVLSRRRRAADEPLGIGGSFALAAAVCSLRGLKTLGWTFGFGSASSDEQAISTAIGLPAAALPLVSCIVGIAVVSRIIVPRLPEGRRFALFASTILAGGAGAGTWVGAVGPRLLP